MTTITSLQSNLLITGDGRVFWKGQEVPGIVSVKFNSEPGDLQVKLKVNGSADALYMELVSAGIIVKKGK